MITLRAFQPDDIPALVQLLNEDAVTRFLSTKIPQPYSPDDASWWVHEGSLSGINRAIEVDGVLAGCIGVKCGEFEYSRSGELGYWLGAAFWQQGIATAAARQLIAEVFEHTDIARIFAVVFSGNQASMALLRKVGFSEEAVLRQAIFKQGQFYDSHVFSLLNVAQQSGRVG